MRFRGRRERLHCVFIFNRGTQIFDHQVPINSGRHPDIAVPHEALNSMDVDSAAKKLGCKSVPQIVKPHA